ncbi:MAG: Holliday junction resolvase RuvX, partial [Acholeplasmataceae bacterium]
MKRYLGLDLGSKTIGISISESGIIASTLTTIRFSENNYEEAALKVTELIQTHQIDCVVLGLPKHMNNDIGIRGKISESFKEMITAKTEAEVILWDERLSTQSAKRVMIQGSQRRKVQKEKK